MIFCRDTYGRPNTGHEWDFYRLDSISERVLGTLLWITGKCGELRKTFEGHFLAPQAVHNEDVPQPAGYH